MGVPIEKVLAYLGLINRSRGKAPGWPESAWQQRQVEGFQRRVDKDIQPSI